MAVAGVVTNIITDHSARTKTLSVAGVDMVIQPGTGGSRVGVPVESVEVVENGPGGVSSMTFTIEDPAKAVTLADHDEVQFWDVTNDVPIFTGWVVNWTPRPDFGQIGRSIDVVCDGYEAVLDYAIVPTAFTFDPTVIQGPAAIQSLVANAIGVGELRALVSASVQSIQAQPICSNIVLLNTVTVGPGTLRECIRQVLDQSSGTTINGTGVEFSIDFWKGLRVWVVPDGLQLPIDWGQLSIIESGIQSTNLEHTTDGQAVVRAVYIKGANAAGTGLVPDGSGIRGRVAYIDDSTIDTTAKLQAAATGYLNQFVLAARGSFELPDRAPSPTVHAGGRLNLTNVAISIAATGLSDSFRIGTIRRTFNPSGRENWTVTYGGLEPTVANHIRRLTRSTIS